MKPRSNKGFAAREVVIVVAVIGLLAALTIPAFRMVRHSSQDKAVRCGIRQLAAAADQYFLENGASGGAYCNLARPVSYVKAVSRGCGETIRVEPEVQIEQATGDQFRQSLYSSQARPQPLPSSVLPGRRGFKGGIDAGRTYKAGVGVRV